MARGDELAWKKLGATCMLFHAPTTMIAADAGRCHFLTMQASSTASGAHQVILGHLVGT